jgi:hypothetical protein
MGSRLIAGTLCPEGEERVRARFGIWWRHLFAHDALTVEAESVLTSLEVLRLGPW